MKMIDSVWTVPVRPSDINVIVRAFHTVPVPNTIVVTSQPKPQYIKYHEALFLPGVNKFFIQYDTTKGAHCGKVTNAEMCQHIETHPSISMGLDTSKYVRCRQKKGKKDRSENPNKVQDDSAPCPETPEKGEDRTKIPSNQTSENKKTKNDDTSGISTATDVASLDISDQGKSNDVGEKPRVLLDKNFSERYKKLKHLRQESQKPGDIWIMDYVIMNQTTEGREQETVALVIMDTYISLVCVVPCKKRGNVLPHILDTITLWGHKPKAIRCDNAQEFINEKNSSHVVK
jgi:hypothetical protein